MARATGADPALVASEAAAALAQMAALEPAGLVPACRRLIERHLTSGPVWWLSARILGADDQRAAAREAAALLDRDRTMPRLAEALPDGASVAILGWPDLIADALRRRGDVEALVVDAGGEGAVLARRLADAGRDAALIPEGRVGSAAAVAELILVEAYVGGPAGVLASPGSLAAAAVGAHLGTPVWAVDGRRAGAAGADVGRPGRSLRRDRGRTLGTPGRAGPGLVDLRGGRPERPGVRRGGPGRCDLPGGP